MKKTIGNKLIKFGVRRNFFRNELSFRTIHFLIEIFFSFFLEMVFSFFATFLMTMMAFNMIRITNWKDKIEKKLNKIISNYLCRNRRQQLPLLLLPFTVICRESLETFIFITGVILNL